MGSLTSGNIAMTNTRATGPSDDDGSPPHHAGIGAWVIVIVLIALLVATAVLAYRGWMLGEGEVPESGYIALTLGVIFSLVFGVGLMALVFYSSRKGYDRPAELVSDEDDDGGDGRENARDEPDGTRR